MWREMFLDSGCRAVNSFQAMRGVLCACRSLVLVSLVPEKKRIAMLSIYTFSRMLLCFFFLSALVRCDAAELVVVSCQACSWSHNIESDTISR
jgi:hypothetical protein